MAKIGYNSQKSLENQRNLTVTQNDHKLILVWKICIKDNNNNDNNIGMAIE